MSKKKDKKPKDTEPTSDEELTYPIILDLPGSEYHALQSIADNYDLDPKEVLFAAINLSLNFHTDEMVMLLHVAAAHKPQL